MAANNNKIWQEAVSATNECPSIEILERVMEGTSTDQKTVAHVSTCPHCQSEVSMLRSFESAEPAENEGAAVAWIAAQLERNQQKQSAPPAKASVVPFWRAVFRLPYMAAAAALVVAVTLGISIYQTEDHKPHFGGNVGNSPFRSGEIHLISPSGQLNQLPAQLRWEPVPSAKSYSIQITGIDLDRTVIWSGQSAQNFVTVTPEMKERIHSGKSFKWTVTAQDATGKQIATGEGGFRLAVP